MSGATSLVGDPASVSALGATMRASAERLRQDAERVLATLEDAEPGWTGPTALGHRRQARAVGEALAATARCLDESGESLQRGASELAARIAELTRIEQEATERGLQVRDGMVSRGWGITGVADADRVSADDDARADLEARLHATASALGRQRARLASRCTQARQTLAVVKESLW